jgi:hypothetical protein
VGVRLGVGTSSRTARPDSPSGRARPRARLLAPDRPARTGPARIRNKTHTSSLSHGPKTGSRQCPHCAPGGPGRTARRMDPTGVWCGYAYGHSVRLADVLHLKYDSLPLQLQRTWDGYTYDHSARLADVLHSKYDSLPLQLQRTWDGYTYDHSARLADVLHSKYDSLPLQLQRTRDGYDYNLSRVNVQELPMITTLIRVELVFLCLIRVGPGLESGPGGRGGAWA